MRLRAHVQLDEHARSRGFGFVSFASPDEAKKAVSELHFKVHAGKPLYVGLAEKKEDRNARLAAEALRYKQGGAMPPGVGMNPGFPAQQMGYPPAGGKGMGKGYGGGGYPQQMPMGYPGMMMQGGKGAPGMQGGPGGYPQMFPAGPRMGPGMQVGPQAQMPMMGKGQMMAQQMPYGSPPRPQMMGPQGGNYPRQQMQNAAPGSNRPMQGQVPLNAASLAAAPPNVQKQMIGEKLFLRISTFQPELAGKITGMMLEMDNSELLILLDSDAQLKQKCDEAVKVLEQIRQQERAH